MGCFNCNKIRLKIIRGCAPGCPEAHPLQDGNIICFDEIIRLEGHCLKMIHSLIPYINTFNRGGWFTWEKCPNQVVVCCSNVPNNCICRLEMIDKKYKITVLETAGDCPFYEKGRAYSIRPELLDNICLGLFVNVYPYYFSEKKERVLISCPKAQNFLIAEIIL